jgi:hypothetical protein
MRKTLNDLVRDRILNEGPQITLLWAREDYVSHQLRHMSAADLLERISDALAVIQSEQSVRLGL